MTPNIVVDNAEQAVAFLKKAFGATENYRLTMSNGKDHALRIETGGPDSECWGIDGRLACTRFGRSNLRRRFR